MLDICLTVLHDAIAAWVPLAPHVMISHDCMPRKHTAHAVSPQKLCTFGMVAGPWVIQATQLCTQLSVSRSW